MQNAKCKMHNHDVPSGQIQIIAEGDTFILHYAFIGDYITVNLRFF